MRSFLKTYDSRPVSREVFFVSEAQRKSQKTRGQQRETVLFPFLCIATRVAGHGVSSNKLYTSALIRCLIPDSSFAIFAYSASVMTSVSTANSSI